MLSLVSCLFSGIHLRLSGIGFGPGDISLFAGPLGNLFVVGVAGLGGFFFQQLGVGFRRGGRTVFLIIVAFRGGSLILSAFGVLSRILGFFRSLLSFFPGLFGNVGLRG